jgi:hypothetical protein
MRSGNWRTTTKSVVGGGGVLIVEIDLSRHAPSHLTTGGYQHWYLMMNNLQCYACNIRASYTTLPGTTDNTEVRDQMQRMRQGLLKESRHRD